MNGDKDTVLDASNGVPATPARNSVAGHTRLAVQTLGPDASPLHEGLSAPAKKNKKAAQRRAAEQTAAETETAWIKPEKGKAARGKTAGSSANTSQLATNSHLAGKVVSRAKSDDSDSSSSSSSEKVSSAVPEKENHGQGLVERINRANWERIQQLLRECVDLRAQRNADNDELYTQILSNDSLKREAEIYKEIDKLIIENLGHKLDIVVSTVEKFEAKLEQPSQQIDSLQKSVAHWNESIGKLIDQSAALAEQNKELTALITVIRKELEQRAEEVAKQEAARNSANAAREATERNLANLRDDLEAAKRATQQKVDELANQQKAHEAALGEAYTRHAEATTAAKRASDEQLAAAKAEHDKTNETLAQTQQELDSSKLLVQQKVDELAQLKQAHEDALAAEKKASEEQLAAANAARETAERTLAQKNQAHEAVIAEHVATKKALGKLQTESEAAKKASAAEIAKLKAQLKEQKRAHEQEMHAAKADSNNKIAEAKAAHDETNRTLEQVRVELATASTQNTELNRLLGAAQGEARKYKRSAGESKDVVILLLAGTALAALACVAYCRMNNIQPKISYDLLKALPSEMYKVVGEATSYLIDSGYKAAADYFRG